MVVLVIDVFNYNPNARLFPLVVGTVAFFLALIQFLVDAFPSMRRLFPFVVEKGVFTAKPLQGVHNESKKTETEQESMKENELLKITLIFSWLIGFVLLFNYFHYLVAVFLFLFTFIWLFSKENPKIALGISVGMCGFLFLVFDLLLGANL